MKAKIVIYSDRWTIGGVESLILNIFQFIDHSFFDISIVVGQKETTSFDNLIDSLHIPFFVLSNNVVSNPILRDLKVLFNLKKTIIKLNPDIVHINVCNSIGFSYAKIIKKYTSAKTIVHSHNSYIANDIFKLKLLFHKINRHHSKYSDFNIACSTLAGNFLFLKSYTILNNGINYKKFEFCKEHRDEIRKKYDLQNKKVILFVGRLSKQKNHLFFLKAFKVILQTDKNYFLLIIGCGELQNKIKKTVLKYNLEKNIKILPPQKEIYKFYSASDLFVMPSICEGLPISGVEAQANGLPSLFSSEISKEIIIGKNSHFLSIKLPKIWSKYILEMNLERSNNYEYIKNKGFLIEDSIKKLQNIYFSLLK